VDGGAGDLRVQSDEPTGQRCGAAARLSERDGGTHQEGVAGVVCAPGEGLDKTDRSIYVGLFNGKQDETGLPPRRGYYLGYLVAEAAAKKRDVRELAKLDCRQANELVVVTIHELSALQH
jgi:hypothetical protein